MTAKKKGGGFFTKRWNIYLWQRAHSLVSKGENEEAIEIYQKLHLPDGLKQITLAQTANAYYRLGEKEKAKRFYSQAIDSERSWGLRHDKNSSTYLINYCEFFLSSIAVDRCDGSAVRRIEKQLQDLRELPASYRMKKYYLPLPERNLS